MTDFEKLAMRRAQLAKELSEEMECTVYVMSDSEDIHLASTDAMKAEYNELGYWVAAIFEDGRQVSA